MNQTNEYLSWKSSVFRKPPNYITSADIVSIISKNVEFVNDGNREKRNSFVGVQYILDRRRKK